VPAYLVKHMSASPDRKSVSPLPRRRVAIVVPGLSARGGLTSVALFLRRAMLASGRYEPHLISLATSSADENSMRLVAPWSWWRGARMTAKKLGDIPYVHVGSVCAELEPFRYRPRAALTELLETFDLVQVVAGTPALAHVARDVRRPVALQCATMVTVERRSLLTKGRGLATAWRRLMTAFVARMDESGLHHADMVLVENAWMRDRVTQAIGANRVRFSPPGVDTTVFHPNGERDSKFVLAVGRLDDPRKNIPMLLEAFAIARAQLSTEVRLVLAGERPPSEEIATLAARLDIADAIDIRLSLSLEDLAALYRRATVFALSSDEEGLGIVALEAMASGVPAVCTRCGGPETSVIEGETGFLVPTGDVKAFADRLVRLLSDSDMRRHMGEAARAHVERTFSLQRTGESFVRVYDELLDHRAVNYRARDVRRSVAT
jgi:glycosyltransferase involved in cell wall biosynthesis